MRFALFMAVRVQIVASWIITLLCHHGVTNISEEHIDLVSHEAACQLCSKIFLKNTSFP